jgi:hypothetical protein
MASGSDMPILSESSSINIALMVGLAEKSFIEPTIISSLIRANQITTDAVINEFKNRLVIYKELHSEALIKDIDNGSWNNTYTEAVNRKITSLQYVWADVYGYLPQPERDNVNEMFQQLMYPLYNRENTNIEEEH